MLIYYTISEIDSVQTQWAVDRQAEHIRGHLLYTYRNC
jgi:hypothetical protein